MSDPNNKRKFKTAMVLYILVLILALSVSFGWFIFSREASIQSASGDDTVQVTVNGGDLEIFLVDSTTTEDDIADDSQWGSTRTFTPESQIYYIDISGDGSQLWFPRMLDGNNEPNLTDGSMENVTDKDGYYVTLKLLFRTTVSMDVYLSSDSYVIPLEYITGQTTYLRRSIYSPSDAKAFSCDGIVGAARVAFLEGVTVNGVETKVLKNLWIPNDLVQLQKPTAGDPDYSLIQVGASELSETGYSYISLDGDDLVEREISPDDYASGKVTVTSGWKVIGTTEDGTEVYANASSAVLASSSLNDSYEAAPLLSFTGDGEMQYKTLYIRLWFEGTDREADSAFSGGMAGYKFNFVGMHKAEPEIPEVYYNSANNGLCMGKPGDADYNTAGASIAENLEYSIDGIKWISYQPDPEGSHPNIIPGATIYLRTAETTSIKRGKAFKLTIPETDETNGE